MPPKQKRQTRKDKLKSELKETLKETREESDKVLANLDSELKEVQKEKENSTHIYWCKKEAYIKERIKLALACKNFGASDASETDKERLRQFFVEFDLKKAIFLEYEREYKQEKTNAEKERNEREKEEREKKKEREREEREKEENDANDEREREQQDSSKGARPKALKCKAYLTAKEELKAQKESEKAKKEIEEQSKVKLTVEEVFINAAKEYPGNTITAVRENEIYVANEKIYIFQNRDRNICMILVTLLLRIPHLISAILCQDAHYMYSTVF